MARKTRRRRRFGAYSKAWALTERLFARQGPAPRRRQACKVELRTLKHVVSRLSRGYPGSAHGSLMDVADAWDLANHGACRKARKKITKIVKAHPRKFQTWIDRMQRAGYVVP